MPLAYALWTIADAARALAKRRGEKPTGRHLTAILAESHTEAFEAVFGDGSAGTYRSDDWVTLSAEPLDEFADGLKARTVTDLIAELKTVVAAWDAAASTVEAAALPGSAPRPDRDVGPEPTAADTMTAPTTPPAEGTTSPPEPDDRIARMSEAVGRPGRKTHRLILPVETLPAVASREDVVREIIAQVTCARPHVVLVTGDAGSGRSALVGSIADAASRLAEPLVVHRLDVTGVLSDGNPLESLDKALASVPEGQILVIDDLELLLGITLAHPLDPIALALQVAARRSRVRLVLMLDTSRMSRLEAVAPDLQARSVPITLPSLTRDELDTIVADRAADIGATRKVSIPRDVIAVATASPGQRDHRSHPGLALDRLDLAAARAIMRGRDQVALEDVDHDPSGSTGTPSVRLLAERLRESVRGQNDAVTAVSRRIALTMSGLDLRPHRPNGVLLFVGPTGVGKTQLAKAVCEALYGDADRLIRLDMSEYSDKWAISRLIGPQPGYVGSDEPESWLTTRVRRQPRTVVLLDEFEKAHPDVWNTFLQVFDAGRLSDPSGKVADFGDTVIVMTSNLGSKSVGNGLGFGSADQAAVAERSRERILGAVKDALAPELLNRLDDIVVFQPLARDAIKEIAHREVINVIGRLADRGYRLAIDDDVIDHLSAQGYEPAYGARNLLRVIEQELLLPLVDQESRDLKVTIESGRLVWNQHRG